MKFWGKRKKSRPSISASLSMEKLESREMMAVIPINSGQATTFQDADGTQVTIKLTGPGDGSLELVNGVLTGAAIDSLVLSGTTGNSKLKISTSGGSVAGTTIHELVITKALNELGALKSFKAPKLDFVDDGRFSANGDIEKLHVRSFGADTTVEVAGSVGKLKAKSLQENASIDVTGALNKFVIELLNTGSQVSAGQLDLLKVKHYANGTNVDVGTGGIGKAKFNNIYSSAIAAEGNVGEILVKGEILATALASNMNKGSDGIFGTIDDFVVDTNATGNINAVKFRGNFGESGTSNEVNIVTSGVVGRVYLNREAERLNRSPSIWTLAASQFVPLSIVQGTDDVPLGRTATGYADDQIWIAVFGEEIVTPPPGTSPVTKPFTYYYLDPSSLQGTTPVVVNTKDLQPSASTPNQVTLPSFTIEQWVDTTGTNVWGSNLAFPAPKPGHEWTGRILISVGAPVQAQVNSINGSISSPNPADLTDPSTGTFYDFLEFTITNPNTSTTPPANLVQPAIDIDTSMVDAFGLPMKLELFQDQAGTEPFALTFAGTLTATTKTISNVTNLTTLIAAGFGTGQPITSATSGALQGGTTVTGYDIDAKTVTISLPAAGSGSNTLTTYSGGPVGVQTPRQTILDANSLASLVSFIKLKISGGSTYSQPFLQSAAAYPKTAATAITGATNPASPSPIQITTGSTTGLDDGDVVLISGVLGNTAANGLFTVSNVTATTFTLDASTGNNAYVSGGTWTAFTSGGRLVSPKDVVEALTDPQDPSPLNNYFNEVIDDFFIYYAATGVPVTNGAPGNNPFNMVSTAFNGTALTYSGKVQLDSTYNTYALTLTETTGTDPNTYRIYYPFFQQNAPAGNIYTPRLPIATALPWITANNWQNESASQMVFACDALFADNIVRKTYDMNDTSAVVLGDLENSISAAFNRGITAVPGTEWSDVSQWFPANSAYNYWVQYWHTFIETYNDLAYAFPYDDKYGASTNLNLQDVGLTQITLGSWGDVQGASSTTLTVQPTTVASQGSVTLTAQIGGANATGTVSFFVDGVPINANDDTLPPIQQVPLVNGTVTLVADLPELPAGAARHTYTITAVYSGDADHLPSIDYDSIEIVQPIVVTVTPNGGVIGSTTQVGATLPGTNTQGTITFSISHSDGSHSQILGAVTNPPSVQVSENYAIPQTLLQFTGNTTLSSPIISNVSSFVDLVVGQVVQGTGIPTGATIHSMNPGLSQLTLSVNATATSVSPVTITSNGDNANFLVTANFVPSNSDPASTGSTTLNISADAYSLLFSPPGSGAVGSQPQMTVTLPGPLYNGTLAFSVSLDDGTESQSLGTPVTVDSSSLTSGNQVVVNGAMNLTQTIPLNLLTFTAYSDGSGTLTGLSTISNLVPNSQNISGGTITSNMLTGYVPATLMLTNPAAATSTSPVTMTVGTVTITGMTTQGQQAVTVSSVTGWALNQSLNGTSITDNGMNQDQYVGAGNTVQNFAPATATTSTVVPASTNLLTFTSSANGVTYPVTATWTPTGGSSLSTTQLFTVTT